MAEADRAYEQATDALRRGEPEAARALFDRSGELGRVDAAAIHANFVAAGIGGPRDWPRALALLRVLAPAHPRSAQALALIEAMALTPEGDPLSPPEGEGVCEVPAIVTFRALFTPAECRYLVETATALLEPALVVDVRTGGQIRDPIRLCDSGGFTWVLEDPAIHALNRRLAAASGTSVDRGETLQVLRYGRGGEYRPHYDSVPGFANQRALTMLVWLTNDYEGGETWFVTPKLALKGQTGMPSSSATPTPKAAATQPPPMPACPWPAARSLSPAAGSASAAGSCY
jgi:prolyl 4-hydroxylase